MRPPTICKCGGAKNYHRPQDNRDHEYEPRFDPVAWTEGYNAAHTAPRVRRLPIMREPTLDELWAAVAASLAVAEEHKTAIYRSGDGVPGPEALAGIQKHIEAGLAARVMYDRLAALRDSVEPA